MGIPGHLTCLLRNLYAGQEETVRTGHGTTEWFQIGKGVGQGCILSPCRVGHDWATFTSLYFKTLLICKTCHGSCMIQFSSVAQSCPTHCDPMDCGTTGLPVHHQLPEFMQTHVHWVGDVIQHLILCCPLLLLPSIFPSIRVFSNESVLHIRWPKYWSFSFSISPSNEYSGPISFRMDWLDLLVVQGTLKSLLQHVWLRKQKHHWI